MAKKIITVFGATGAQGGGLARAILARAGKRIRCCARSPASRNRRLTSAGPGRRGGGRRQYGRCRQREECDEGRVGRVLRHVFLGTLLARPGKGAGHKDGDARG